MFKFSIFTAIELNKYGWFWDCPNGGDKCHYRHALPPGFVLKKDMKKDKKDDITIEELVEIERSKLGYNLTKITFESFLAWKKKKIEEKKAKDRCESDRKKAEFRAGKNTGLSGREMFTFNPDLALDNEMEEGEATMEFFKDEDDDESNKNIKEIDIDQIVSEAFAADGSGTQSTQMNRNFAETSSDNKATTTTVQAKERLKTDQIEENGIENYEDINDEPIDESLFAGDDLLELECQLDSIQLE